MDGNQIIISAQGAVTFQRLFGLVNNTASVIPATTVDYTIGIVTSNESGSGSSSTDTRSWETSLEVCGKYGFSKLSSVSVTASAKYGQSTSTTVSSQMSTSKELTQQVTQHLPIPALNPGESYYVYQLSWMATDTHAFNFPETHVYSEPASVDEGTLTVTGIPLPEGEVTLQCLADVASSYYLKDFGLNQGLKMDYTTVANTDGSARWILKKADQGDVKFGANVFWVVNSATQNLVSSYDGDVVYAGAGSAMGSPGAVTSSLWILQPAGPDDIFVVRSYGRTDRVLSWYKEHEFAYAGDAPAFVNGNVPTSCLWKIKKWSAPT